MRIKRVAIVGMGALGIMYGAIIRDYVGDKKLTFIMDADRFVKYSGEPVNVNGREIVFNISTPQDAKPVDLVIVATKMTGLEEAIEEMKGFVDDDTVIISVLNGITSEEVLAKHFRKSNIVYTVAQGMDAVKLGNRFAVTKTGELHIGRTLGVSPHAYDALVDFFDKAGVKYVEEQDIVTRMWKKFMLNCGINQTCMVYGMTYGDATEEGSEAFNTFVGAMKEVQTLAAKLRISIDDSDIDFYVDLMKSLGYNSMPSMAQDRINKKPTEVEAFSGTVIRLAEQYGVEVPINRMLYARAKELENAYLQG